MLFEFLNYYNPDKIFVKKMNGDKSFLPPFRMPHSTDLKKSKGTGFLNPRIWRIFLPPGSSSTWSTECGPSPIWIFRYSTCSLFSVSIFGSSSSEINLILVRGRIFVCPPLSFGIVGVKNLSMKPPPPFFWPRGLFY